MISKPMLAAAAEKSDGWREANAGLSTDGRFTYAAPDGEWTTGAKEDLLNIHGVVYTGGCFGIRLTPTDGEPLATLMVEGGGAIVDTGVRFHMSDAPDLIEALANAARFAEELRKARECEPDVDEPEV